MGRVLLVIGLIVGLVLLLIATGLDLFLPNLGLPVGYYGRYNQGLRELRSTPEISLDDCGFNRDVSLEEIWINAVVHDRYAVRIFIPQTCSATNPDAIFLEFIEQPVVFGEFPQWTWTTGQLFAMGDSGPVQQQLGRPVTSLAEFLVVLPSVMKTIGESPDVIPSSDARSLGPRTMYIAVAPVAGSN